MPRPIIGLTTYAEEARFGLQDTFSAVLPLSYVHAVHESGGRAVLVTPDAPDPDVLDGLHGIMFTGGADIDPALYGADAHPTTRVKPIRDHAEMMLMRAAISAGLPLLGVCRGMQLMAVAYGGTLYQHLPEALGHHNHRPVSGPKFGHHQVRMMPGSRAQAIMGNEVTVNSFHHQGVDNPGRLRATGWCPADNLIEVVEDPDLPYAIGVQWHPEDTSDFRVFEAFVEAADKHRVSVS